MCAYMACMCNVLKVHVSVCLSLKINNYTVHVCYVHMSVCTVYMHAWLVCAMSS